MVKEVNSTQTQEKGKVLLAIVGLVLITFLQPNLGLGNFQTIVLALVFIGFSALENRKATFRSMGFKKEYFKRKDLLLYASLAGVVLCALYMWVLMPLANALAGSAVDLSVFNSLEGNTSALLLALPFIWVTAAFGEEIVYRGYLMPRLQGLLGKEKTGIILSILISSIIFGYSHSYQGLSGQLLAGMVGLILALTYHFRKGNLWFNVMVHGAVDTIALFIFYSGWQHSLF